MDKLITDLSDSVLPKHENKWDHIRIEIWADTGRIISFPHNTALDDRIDNGGVIISCSELEGLISALDDSDKEESEYDLAHTALLAPIAELLYTKFDNAKLNCDIWSYDDTRVSK